MANNNFENPKRLPDQTTNEDESNKKIKFPLTFEINILPVKSNHKWALIVSDLQNEFINGKYYPVKDSYQLIPIINNLLSYVKFDLVIYSKAAKLCQFFFNYKTGVIPISFKKMRNYYSPFSYMSQLAKNLNISPLDTTVYHVLKSTNQPNSVLRAHSPMEVFCLKERMKELDITHIFTCGLTTDDSVLLTATEALEIGQSYILKDACCSNVCTFDDDMIDKVTKLNIKLATTTDLIQTVTAKKIKRQRIF